MSVRDDLASIVERLKAIEKIFANYCDAIRTAQERERQLDSNPRRIRAEIAFDDASKTDNKTEADRQYRTQNAMRWTTFAAFCAAIIYAGIAAIQLNEMHTQTQEIFRQAGVENNDAGVKAAQWLAEFKIAQQQATAAQNSVAALQWQTQQDQRAWIAVMVSNSDKFQLDQPMSASFHISNIGKTPARGIVGYLAVSYYQAKSEPEFLYGKDHPAIYLEKNILFPTEGIPITLPALNVHTEPGRKDNRILLTLPMLGDLASEKSYVIVHGRLTYRDIFGTHHWLTFCSHVSGSQYETSPQCIRYNNADTNSDRPPN